MSLRFVFVGVVSVGLGPGLLSLLPHICASKLNVTLLDSFFSGTAERRSRPFRFLVGRWESSRTDGTRSPKFRVVCVVSLHVWSSPSKAIMHGIKALRSPSCPVLGLWSWDWVCPTMGCVRPAAYSRRAAWMALFLYPLLCCGSHPWLLFLP